jgi:hypothetical protein
MTAKRYFCKSFQTQTPYALAITEKRKVSIFAVIAVTLSSFRFSIGQSATFTLWITQFFMTDLSTGLSAMSCPYRYGNVCRDASQVLGICLGITLPAFAFISVSR